MRVTPIQHQAVEDNPALRNLPLAMLTAQNIFTAASEQVFLAFQPFETAAVGEEIGIDLDLICPLRGHDFHIANKMPRTRWRILRPGHAGIKALHPQGQTRLALIKKAEHIEFLFHLPLLIRAFTHAVVARGHPVAHVFRQKSQPIAKFAVIQQPCLAVEKCLYIKSQLVIHRPSPRPSACKSCGGSVRHLHCRFRLAAQGERVRAQVPFGS